MLYIYGLSPPLPPCNTYLSPLILPRPPLPHLFRAPTFLCPSPLSCLQGGTLTHLQRGELVLPSLVCKGAIFSDTHSLLVICKGRHSLILGVQWGFTLFLAGDGGALSFSATTFLSLLLKGQNLISAPPHHNQPKGKKDAKKVYEYRDGIDEKDKSKIRTNFVS